MAAVVYGWFVMKTANRIHRILGMLGVFLCAMSLISCSGGSSLNGNIANGSFSETGGQTAALSGSASASAQRIFAANATPSGQPGQDEDYRIAPLDLLEISVFGVKELDRPVQVSSSGMISLPLIKTVKAAGLTQTRLEQQIAAKLEAKYLQSPQVSVFVKEYNSQRITVDGAVQKPGIFPIVGKVSLMQAIALAQGLTVVADPSGVLVFRTVNDKRMAARFDLSDVRSGKINDPFLQPGDIVMVDESKTRTALRDISTALPLTGLFQFLAL
jgi:polysaccharide export outer membrane protein